MNTFQPSLSIAIDGFLLNASARRLSPNTIKFYEYILRNVRAAFPDDPPIAQITKPQIEQFLAGLTVGNTSVLRHHSGLSALWRWAQAEGYVPANLVRSIPQPKPDEKVIEPFTQNEIKLLLMSVDKSLPYRRAGKRESQHTCANAARNRAMIYLLLDTGLRASELCSLTLKDIDLKARKLTVMGKGRKERMIPFDAQTGQTIWRYLATRKDEPVDWPLFPAHANHRHPLDQRDLYHTLRVIGARAGIDDVHPHRFRHTFAIQFLRNGGDVYTLQDILGHTTLEMTRRYLHIAQTDIAAAHRIASPVANWRL